jgi:hypothetical protein
MRQCVRADDIVCAFDLTTSKWKARRVVETYEHDYEGVLVTLTVGDEVIESTTNHPFWVVAGDGLDERPESIHAPVLSPDTRTAGRWVDVGELCVGDELLLKAERRGVVTRLAARHVRQKVYNFQVEEVHTYAVGESGILVHNKRLNNPARRPGSIDFGPPKKLGASGVAPKFNHSLILDELSKTHPELKELSAGTPQEVRSGLIGAVKENEGIVYFVMDRQSGELLKVGYTGGANASSRMNQYITWAARERALLGRYIELEIFYSKPMSATRAEELEGLVRASIDKGAFRQSVSENPTLRWDWSQDRMPNLGITDRDDPRVSKPLLYSKGSAWRDYAKQLKEGTVTLERLGSEDYAEFSRRLKAGEFDDILFPPRGGRRPNS